MRALLAFVVCLGIVLVAIVGGLGSGLMIANITGPHAPKLRSIAAAPAAKPQEKPQEKPQPQDKPKQSSAPASREPAAKGEQAFAKARTTDVKRMTEKRKPERRQRWADRRRYQPRDDQQQDQRQDTERSASNEAEPQDVAERPVRAFTERPMRIEFPPIRPFGLANDDDEP